MWICPFANGHIQAVGRDQRGRKQFRYHDDYRAARDEAKFDRMVAFGKVLPKIRRRIARDIAKPGLARNKVLAAVVRLLETSLIRVGNEEYAKDNGSFGLTTLKDRHVTFSGDSSISLSRQERNQSRDRPRRSTPGSHRGLPGLAGARAFQFLDEDGDVHDVGSADVNDYLREIAGEEFTARTSHLGRHRFGGTGASRNQSFDSDAQAKRNVMAAIRRVAEKLGNTPAVCRKCYVHPRVIDSYLKGTMLDAMRRRQPAIWHTSGTWRQDAVPRAWTAARRSGEVVMVESASQSIDQHGTKADRQSAVPPSIIANGRPIGVGTKSP